jgi:lysyl-tRNA synthetase class 2
MPPASLPLRLLNSHAVASTSLATVAYDAERTVLQVEFRDRTVYQYIGVPSSTYQDLCQAESKGVHFNEHIRDRFAYAKLSAVTGSSLG